MPNSENTPEDTTTDTPDQGGGAGGEADTTPGAAEEELSYEQARDELDSVVRRLESGGLTLQESLELWERGERLAATCERWLEGARAKLAAAMSEQEEGQDADSATQTPF